MNGYATLPPGYGGGFNQGYAGGQQYATQIPQNQMQVVGQPQQQKQQQMTYLCVPVSSREEAMGVRAEIFSMGTIMPDLAHGCVYLKRLNQSTGTSEFYEFGYIPPKEAPIAMAAPQEKAVEQATPKFVAQEDFNKLCSAFVQLQKEFKAIKGMMEAEDDEQSA